MIYINVVLNEFMWLFLFVWIIDRENVEDDSLGDFNIKKGILIGVFFYELYCNFKYWENLNEFIFECFFGE